MISEKERKENGSEIPEGCSAQRKAEIVLRLQRGEDLGEVSRETRVPPIELEPVRQGVRCHYLG